MVLLKAARFKTESYFSAAYFRGVDSSLIVCVFLHVCELIFMDDKGYLAESNDNIFVAS
jgi:hypothetical protein